MVSFLNNESNRSAVETLLQKGFTPTRPVVLAFGFDEETSGLFVSRPFECTLEDFLI